MTDEEDISFTYTNYRGEVSRRTVRPRFIYFSRSNKYHPEPQWFLCAWDNEKNALRDFALKDCVFGQESLVSAARTVLASWDERGQEREQLVKSSFTGQEYWSPKASLVDSEAIAKLRAELEKHDGE